MIQIEVPNVYITKLKADIVIRHSLLQHFLAS